MKENGCFRIIQFFKKKFLKIIQILQTIKQPAKLGNEGKKTTSAKIEIYNTIPIQFLS